MFKKLKNLVRGNPVMSGIAVPSLTLFIPAVAMVVAAVIPPVAPIVLPLAVVSVLGGCTMIGIGFTGTEAEHKDAQKNTRKDKKTNEAGPRSNKQHNTTENTTSQKRNLEELSKDLLPKSNQGLYHKAPVSLNVSTKGNNSTKGKQPNKTRATNTSTVEKVAEHLTSLAFLKL